MAIELPRQAGPSGAAPTPQEDSQQWAIQRRIEDVFTKLGEKFGDLSGRVVVTIRPETSFEDVGGIAPAKAAVRGFTTALTNPDLYRKWGISPPKGILLYGPRGTGKTMSSTTWTRPLRSAQHSSMAKTPAVLCGVGPQRATASIRFRDGVHANTAPDSPRNSSFRMRSMTA